MLEPHDPQRRNTPEPQRELTPKFKCPRCQGYRSHVVRGDARADEAYWRRRQCEDCGQRFNTAERVENLPDR